MMEYAYFPNSFFAMRHKTFALMFIYCAYEITITDKYLLTQS